MSPGPRLGLCNRNHLLRELRIGALEGSGPLQYVSRLVGALAAMWHVMLYNAKQTHDHITTLARLAPACRCTMQPDPDALI